jgi:hypothetical protein
MHGQVVCLEIFVNAVELVSYCFASFGRNVSLGYRVRIASTVC